MKHIKQNLSLLICLTAIALLSLAALVIPAIQAQQGGATPTPTGAMASDPVVGLSPDSPWRPVTQPTDLVEVIVELEDPPAVEVYAQARENTAARAAEPAAAAQAQLARIEQAQQTLVDELAGSRIGATVTGRLQRVYNGIALQVEASKLDEIRALPGVKAVHPDGVLYPSANNAVPFIGAPTAWTTGMGVRGEGIKIGIIDSGIDYLHRNFGGPGTGYESNDRTIVGDAPGFPGVKVAGGYDFIGDDYDPESEDPANRIPRPDPDPMDCSGHGTAVTSIAAGQGVNTDGSTYTGPYDTTTPFASLKIGPGVAPKATLYALKVSSCGMRHPFSGGRTSFSVVAQAVEWSVDPNGDGDFSDRLDVINVSLQQQFQRPENPSAIAINNAVSAGVIAVIAAGNSGDAYYVTGGPRLAGRGICAAASVDTGVVYLGLRINSPANLAGQIEAAPVIIGPPMSATPITTNLAAPEPASACAALTNAAAVNGRIALINAGGCSYTIKVRNAQNAGAVAVVFVHTITFPPLDVLPLNIIDEITDLDIRIPSVIITLSNANLIRANLPNPGVNITLSANQVIPRPDLADTVAWFSSRGPGLNSQLKPDIAAPGEMTISTAQSGSGAGTILFNGTSSASPFVAGAMALLRQMHPDWSIEELKALVMNTATFDLFSGANSTLPKYGLGRIGAGRIALQNAAAANVVAYNATDPGLVSVSFGVVEVVGTVARSKTIRVVNKGAAAMTYQLAYAGITDVPGVSFSLPGGNTITVPANGSTTFEVRLNATAAQMKHTRDATVSATDYITSDPSPRHWLSEEGGYITLTPASGSVLRVPVYAAPRPASNMTTSQTQLGFTADSGTLTLNLTGQGVNTGTAYPTDELSLVHPFELADISPNDDAIPDSLDLKYVGVTSDFKRRGSMAGTLIYFGIATHGNWSTPSEVEVTVGIDTNQDGVDDFEVRNGATHPSFSGDAFIVRARNAATGVIFSRTFFLNSASADQYNSVPYNTNVMVLLVRAADLGLTEADAKFDYQVRTRVRFTEEVLDQSKRLTFDAARPGLSFGNFAFYFDTPGNTIPVQYNRADFYAAGSRGALLLHHHNTAGNHDQVLFASALTPAIASLSPNSALIGSPAFTLTVNGSNFNTGSVVRWNGVDRITSFVSTTRLTANIPASDLSVAGAASVTVFTPAPGGGASNALSFTVIIQGYEADVAPRPNGDNNGTVTIADWTQIGRFVSGLDTAENGSEFQRADCGPRNTLGNGQITVSDWVQAGRYAAGLDPVAPAGGPTGQTSAAVASTSGEIDVPLPKAEAMKVRVMRAVKASGFLNIQLDAQGDENAVGFSLHYDPRQMRFVIAALNRKLSRAAFLVNTRQAASGRIGFLLALPAGERLAAGAQSLMTIYFSGVVALSPVDAQAGFGDEPVTREIADVSAESLAAIYAGQPAAVQFRAPASQTFSASPSSPARTRRSFRSRLLNRTTGSETDRDRTVPLDLGGRTNRSSCCSTARASAIGAACRR